MANVKKGATIKEVAPKETGRKKFILERTYSYIYEVDAKNEADAIEKIQIMGVGSFKSMTDSGYKNIG